MYSSSGKAQMLNVYLLFVAFSGYLIIWAVATVLSPRTPITRTRLFKRLYVFFSGSLQPCALRLRRPSVEVSRVLFNRVRGTGLLGSSSANFVRWGSYLFICQE